MGLLRMSNTDLDLIQKNLSDGISEVWALVGIALNYTNEVGRAWLRQFWLLRLLLLPSTQSAELK